MAEPGLAALAALLLITAAQAALPGKLRPLAAPKPRPAPAVEAAPEPAVLIAFTQPVAGYPIVSPFGLRQMPWEKQGRLHEGVDIAAPEGQPIAASADGVVVRAGESPSYGRFVEIRHAAGLSTFYAHMGAIDPAIGSGTAVKAGTRIGTIGNTGSSTGPHLHFEVRDVRPLDPQAFLGKSFASVDLLPLRQAAKVSGHVRIAYVSHIPASKRALMGEKPGGEAAGAKGEIVVAEDGDGAAAKPGSWMRVRLDEHQRVRGQIRRIAEAQHQEAAPAAPPSAADAAAAAPIEVAPAPLDVAG